MPAKRTAAEILGKPPWTDDQLAKAYLSDFTGIYRALHIHAGHHAHSELEQLKLSKRLFDKAVSGLQSAVEAFLIHSTSPRFRTRELEAESEDLILSVQAALFQTVTTAIAFRDRTRTLARRLSIPEFQNRFETVFGQNKRSQFVCALRDHFSHVAPLVAEWQLSRAGRSAPKVAKFLLQVADLEEAMKQDRKHWDPLARGFVDDHRARGVIDVVLLFSDHSKDVEEFYHWLYSKTEANAGQDLIDYRDVEQRFNCIAMKMAWNAWVLPWMHQSDPRFVLNQYLTKTEMKIVDSLPVNSREQVDKIIEFVDAEHTFMDDEMKRAIYKRFGV
jgi:hypothetical protein